VKTTPFQHTSDATVRHAWAGFTPELLERARRRVRVLAWLLLGVMVLGTVADFAAVGLFGGTLQLEWIGYGVLAIGTSGALVYIANDRRIGHAVVLHTMLAYEIGVCFVIALVTPRIFYNEIGHLPIITWVTPLIILFPLIVPSPPRLTLAVALSAAATRPLTLLWIDLGTDIDVAGLYYYTAVISPLFAVGMAYFGSRVVHGMTVDLAKAQRLGSYRLESRLGTGGMGEVWRARHQLLVRPAAVKLVKPETLGISRHDREVVLARFEREAQVTAAMRSAHTVQLYDFGISRSGAFYYVMELLDGLDLEELVNRFGPVNPARVTYFLMQVCDSLAEAHEQGLIHRDIKPGNVYVCRYGRMVDFVKVLDFGLVKVHQDGGESDQGLTAHGTVGGTPAFIAPEQAVGDEVDARTDIYQLGCVAYWMLTGAYVFRGDTAMKTMLMHVRDRPEAPSRRTEQPIPGDLERLVLHCLEKEPANRPQTVDRLVERLTACDLEGAWTQQHARRWWEVHLPDRLERAQVLSTGG
jgi:serine/threonine-protein kinase